MPYQSTPQDLRRAWTICIIYVVLAIALGIMLFKIWPPIPWPSPELKQKGALAAFLANTGCPVESPTPTPTPTTRPAAANNAQTPNPTAGTQPSAGGQTGTQPTGQPGATQPDGQAAGGTQTTPPAADNIQTNPQSGVTIDPSGEIILMPIRLYGTQCVQTTYDERLLLLVIVAGILGAFVHGATSLADYIGNNNFNKSWTWFYLLRPAIGMSLALVFYFVIRGGFLSTTGGAQDINPYGIAALSCLVGMFSKQATDKLSEVFGTLFRSAGDARRQDPLQPTTPAATIQLEPASAVAGGAAFQLAVSGTGFVNGATINVDDVAQATTFESATRLTAQIAPEIIANPGTLRITVVNPDQTPLGPANFVVSPGAGGPPPEEQAGDDDDGS